MNPFRCANPCEPIDCAIIRPSPPEMITLDTPENRLSVKPRRPVNRTSRILRDSNRSASHVQECDEPFPAYTRVICPDISDSADQTEILRNKGVAGHLASLEDDTKCCQAKIPGVSRASWLLTRVRGQASSAVLECRDEIPMST